MRKKFACFVSRALPRRERRITEPWGNERAGERRRGEARRGEAGTGREGQKSVSTAEDN